MTKEMQQEQFSIAYVRAVAAAAGYAVYTPSVDEDSVDIGIAARGPHQTCRSPRLELQLKCTTSGQVTGPHLAYQLSKKNHDDLRPMEFLVPRLLVVVSVPNDISSWLAQTDAQLVFCHCGYWLSLRGEKEVVSTAKDVRTTVHLPRGQQFTVEALRKLMAAIGRGEKP